MAYSGITSDDILDDFAASRRPRSYPEVVVEMGLRVADRSSGFVGAVVRWNAEGVTLQNDEQYVRHFTWKPGGFVADGGFVTLVRPSATAAAVHRVTASGSIAGDGRARVAAASRIWVEGRHDAELLEHVWGDDLRELGIVVEPLHGADDLAEMVADFGPAPSRRLGVLLDHLVAGSKESRIAETVRDPQVQHRDMLRELPTWTGETLTVSNTPVKHSRTRGGAERGAAKPGEHSREVLGTVGFLDAELDDLVERGVIRTEPADAG